jgi:hypothetical protein
VPKFKRQALENFGTWRAFFQNEKVFERVLLAVFGTESKQQLEADILSNAPGCFATIQLALRSEGVAVACVRVDDVRPGMFVEDAFVFCRALVPDHPKHLVCVVNSGRGKEGHWDLGGLSTPQGLQVLFPLTSWKEDCQKILDFLVLGRLPPAWEFPEESTYCFLSVFLTIFFEQFFVQRLCG